jgi:transcriptional regulator with XRE-family HTH domain
MEALAERLTGLKLKHLISALGGQSSVARLLGVHRSRVSRWLAGEEPDPGNKARLEGLEFVLSRLHHHFSPATATKWLSGINAHLGNLRPLDLIAHNRIAEVIAAVEQAELGSYA